jgi:hypothetical protein
MSIPVVLTRFEDKMMLTHERRMTEIGGGRPTLRVEKNKIGMRSNGERRLWMRMHVEKLRKRWIGGSGRI